MLKNTRGYTRWKVAIIILALILLAYGYYGYIYVPNNANPYGGGPKCLFGPNSYLSSTDQPYTGFDTRPCIYSLHSLIVGIILIIVILGLAISGKK